MVVLYTTLLTLAAGPGWQSPPEGARTKADADRLYRDRGTLASAQAAAAIWSAALAADPDDFDSAWRVARAQYWIGGHVPRDQVRAAFERGMHAAERAIAIHGDRPEGHFWLAANMAGLAETQGMMTGLRYKSSIREALERVLAIDPAFQQGSADRALGRWYYEVPRLFGGSKTKSETHLRRALAYNPRSTVTWLFLADTLEALGRDAEARSALQHVVDAPLDPDWTPEDLEFKAQAKRRLERRER